jgi:hypothetical protein
MSPDHAPDDALLRRYLLGQTTAEESDRIDELSVTSDELAARLQSMEYDLTDEYAAGELSGDALEAFRSTYPLSSDGRAQVRFAQTLRSYQSSRSRSVSAFDASAPASVSSSAPAARRWSWRSGFESNSRWMFAVAATILLIVAGVLFVQNQSLRGDVERARAERTTIEDRARGLQQQLDAQRAAADANETAAKQAAVKTPSTTPTVIAAFVLPPPSRGVGNVATIAPPPGIDTIRFHAPIEGEAEHDRSATFEAVLRDATSNQIVWRGAGPRAGTGRNARFVAVTLPAHLLKPRTYLLELLKSSGSNGAGGDSTPEPFGSYAFHVVNP